MTIPFPSDVPILGQQIELKSWFPTAMIVCKCSVVPNPILLVGEAPVTCLLCQKSYVIAQVQHAHGQPPKIVIGIVTGAKAAS